MDPWYVREVSLSLPYRRNVAFLAAIDVRPPAFAPWSSRAPLCSALFFVFLR